MYGFIFKYIQCNNFEKNQKFLGLLLNNTRTVEYMQPLFNHSTPTGAPTLCCLL